MTSVVRSALLGGLLLLPPAASLVEAAGPAPSAAQDAQRPPARTEDTVPCQTLVDRQVQVARNGNRDAAERGLLAVASRCPQAAAALRELGAARASTPATPPAPSPLMRDYTIRVDGLKRIDRSVLDAAASFGPDEPLTRADLERAARRIESIPGVSSARVVVLPPQSSTSTSTIDIQVKERTRMPHGIAGWSTLGGRGILSDEARVDIANLTSGGEVWAVGYRWSRPRERVMARLEIPAPRLPGVLAIEGLIERQTYRPSIPGVAFDNTEFVGEDLVQRRRRIGMQVADWATGWWRWMGGAAFDSIGEREYLGVDAGVDFRALRDHVSLIVLTGFWSPLTDGDRFASALTTLAWRSSTDETPISFYGEVGLSAVSERSPLALWPGNHTSAERGGNLRAHPLRESDVITGAVFGRRVAFGSFNAEQLIAVTKFGRVSLAEFVDTGRAWQRLPGLPTSPLHVDVGLGLRLAGSKAGGTVRIDYARGVRDGRNHVSAGFVKAWPGR